MRILPFEPAHVAGVRVHSKQARWQSFLESGIPSCDSWSVFHDDRLVAVGGIVATDQGIAGWGLFTEHMRTTLFVAVHRIVRSVLRESGGMIVHVDPAFPEARRWAAALGLEPTGVDTIDGRPYERFCA